MIEKYPDRTTVINYVRDALTKFDPCFIDSEMVDKPEGLIQWYYNNIHIVFVFADGTEITLTAIKRKNKRR